jgi:hypothetical protein
MKLLMGKNMINVTVEVKFGINNYCQVCYRIGSEYRGLAESVNKEHYMSYPADGYNFSFMQLAVHRPCTDLISDCRRRQSSGHLMERKILKETYIISYSN